ncbi:MAG: hypothetical protein U9N40_04380 [Euryarchaeota archaeon]|nr:hypothetical protein [Euryarchaeota archaeon]
MKLKKGMRSLFVLLAMLLVSVVVVSAMVPMTSAEDQIKTDLLFQNQETENNIYTMLEVEQPSREEGYQWQTYSEAKDQVDELIRGSEDQNRRRTLKQ